MGTLRRLKCFLFFSVFLLFPALVMADFQNGGFETGTFSSWSNSYKRNNTGLTPSTNVLPAGTKYDYSSINLSNGTSTDNQMKIVTNGDVDPFGIPTSDIPLPLYGKYVARVNGPINYYKTNVMQQTITLSAADIDPIDNLIHIRFAYAPVLENPNHPDNAQPYFFVGLKRANTNQYLYSRFHFAKDSTAVWKTINTGSGNTPEKQYLPWQKVHLWKNAADVKNRPIPDLASGDVLELEIIGADCAYGGHAGYVYVDNLTTNPSGLFVQKSAPSSIAANDTMDYSFSYGNMGDVALNNVKIIETLPPQVSFISASDPNCLHSAGVVTCNFSTLPVTDSSNASANSFTVLVAVSAGASGTISNNNYTIEASGYPPVNGTTINTMVLANPSSDLSISKTSSGSTYHASTPVSYEITVRNEGAITVTDATVMDSFSQDFTATSWSCNASPGSSCGTASGNGNINEKVTLAANGYVKYIVTAILSSSKTGILSNTATVTAPSSIYDPELANNSSTVTLVEQLSIFSSTGTNGSISPLGLYIFDAGTDQPYVFTPASGCKISDVKVDNVSRGPIPYYTFYNITTSHTIDVTFACAVSPSWTITATSGTNGTISPAGSTVVQNDGSQIFLFTPSAGYKVKNVVIDGISRGPLTTYTFSNITSNHTIEVVFDAVLVAPTVPAPYTINATAGSGGVISPTGISPASGAPSTYTYIITPAAGYEILDVKVNGISQKAISTFTFSSITSNKTISASFAKQYTITSSAGIGGTIFPSTPVNAIAGKSYPFKFTPNIGRRIKDVKVNGISRGAIPSFTFYSVSSNQTIEVFYY